ncbi:hypothetical protein J7T55_001359 [Diaporthe amygdali]|uniref:uncharacterized protein n=1 Tax=Phomopsis amygdali TaxID=1214568 RepID=UPI0022FE35AF|nr:uncharacterized protein J7T55_001359 [Diaporthe amygdali]KAJ0100655.1 hypothetical protein J7T55_001359 [Diaporthe amygdali]
MSFKRPNENDITVTDAVRVDVRLSVPWRLRPGQYIYLCILRAGLTSFAQMHPFYVAWGYRDEDGHDHAVLIVEKQDGFTKKIVAHAHAAEAFSDCPKLKALIGGPYGQEMGLGFFGTVILFATGIGIAAQLPYISELLRDYSNNETRRIALFWQVESEAWVADHMQELLSQDVNRILDIHLFVVGGFLSRNTRRGDIVSRGERIDVTYSAMDAKEIIGAEMNGRKGRVVISLCVKDEINREIRRAVRQRPESSFHIKEIPFQPMDRKGYEDVLTALLKLARLLFVR